jgi:uroporphyrinogen-III synthase
MTIGQPLAGRRILVTRTREQAGTLTEALTQQGATVVELPTIEIVPLDSYDALDAALRNVSSYQWLIVTSGNTVRVIRDRMTALGIGPQAFQQTRIVAIGSATASALQAAGLHVDVIPERAVGESVVDALRDRVHGQRVLLVRASVARDVIPAGLASHGATVDIVDAYRTEIPIGSAARLREHFADAAQLPHAVTFTSSSTAHHFFRLLNEAGIAAVPTGIAALSIGPVTSATLREHGWEPTAEAAQSDVSGLVEAAVRALRS